MGNGTYVMAKRSAASSGLADNRNFAAEQRWVERPVGFTDEEWDARCFGPPGSDNAHANRSPPVGTRVATRTDPKQGQEWNSKEFAGSNHTRRDK